MIDWEHIDYGTSEPDFYIKGIVKENLEKRIYEKYFEVEKDDVVVDIGGSIGIFTMTILEKSPKHCWVIEPIEKNFRAMLKNLYGHPVSFLRLGITDGSTDTMDFEWGGTENVKVISFKKLIKDYCIDKIDFLKVDCEGNEYDIFTEENLDYLKSIPKISSEFHLSNSTLKEKFRYFRDNILTKFENYEINAIDGTDIKWNLLNERFIEYYTEILIYIKNKKGE